MSGQIHLQECAQLIRKGNARGHRNARAREGKGTETQAFEGRLKKCSKDDKIRLHKILRCIKKEDCVISPARFSFLRPADRDTIKESVITGKKRTRERKNGLESGLQARIRTREREKPEKLQVGRERFVFPVPTT